VRFVRLALKVLMQNDGDFVDVIVLYAAEDSGVFHCSIYCSNISCRPDTVDAS
jgi:hypothetical protein